MSLNKPTSAINMKNKNQKTTQKIQAGIYKVTTSKGILMVRGGVNYNPHSQFFKNGGYEIWSASSTDECTDLNCWACGAPSKKIAMQLIEEYEKTN